MGDSDEEFDKRRGRDKFRRERPDYPPERRERGGWEDNRGRGEWRGKRDRNDSYGGDYDRGRGHIRGGSPQRYGSPPQAKRMKRDWDEFEHGGPAAAFGGDAASAGGAKGGGPDLDFPTQPPMMTFKSFLQQQEDNITDEEAIKKFNEYKLDFKKQQINEFFLQHKEEEWFKAKYHPEEYDKRKDEADHMIKRRCEVFAKLLEMGMVQKGSCDVDNSAEVIKLLDAAVILMEGGTDFDLQCLEEEHKFYQEEKMIPRQISAEPVATPAPVVPVEKPVEKQPEEKPEEVDDEGDGEIKDDDDEDEEMEDKQESSEKTGEEDPASTEEPDKPKEEEETTETTTTTPVAEKENGDAEPEIKENGVKKKKKSRKEPGQEDDSDSGSESSESEAEEDKEEKGDEPPPPGMEGSAPESYMPTTGKNPKEDSQEEEKEKDTAEPVDEGEPRPRPLHKTQSIFLRNLAPNITKQEIEAMCRTYPGFLRLALQDPAPERKFFRRGWATFDRSVNIKEICWNLTNIRLKDCELGAIVNRELKQRVRPVNGITANRTVSKADIKHCAKIVQNYDKRWGLWEEPQEKKDNEKMPRFGLISNNPVLKNITDYLVDEGSYEEEAYLGKSLDEPCNDSNPEVPLDRDDELLRVLDRMVLYLRIVHSFDYYSCVEYPNEDEMPHRCGIMHGRGPPPLNRVVQGEIEDWIQHFDRKIAPWEELKVYLSEDEAKRLGKKDEEAECEKYIQGNTQELAKDKWLCPLSGKKFKGPDFVRKHIQNKHGEKLEEVKQEVSYFNNYLLDPKRPQLPDHPANKHGGVPSQRPDPGYAQGPPTAGAGGYQPPPHSHHAPGGGYQMGGYNNYRGGPPMPYGRGRGGPPMRGYHQSGYNRGGYNNYHDKPDYRRERSYDRNYPPVRRDRSRPDPRGIVEYRDLDALKEDSDTFFVLDES